jgi:hypothetical protein
LRRVVIGSCTERRSTEDKTKDGAMEKNLHRAIRSFRDQVRKST